MQFNPNQQRETSNYVLTSPHLHLIFWGSLWVDATTKDSGGHYTNLQAKAIVSNLLFGVGTSPWANTVTQYCQGGGIGQGSTTCNANSTYITNPLTVDAIVDPDNARPPSITQAATDTEAQWAYGRENNDINGVYMIFTPSGVGWNLASGCAWHTMRTTSPLVTYSVVPYAPDAGTSCYQQDVNPLINDPSTGGYGDGWFDGLTIAAMHEYAENVTDPYFGGWYDSTGLAGEIGDKCYPGLNEMFSLNALVDYTVPLGNIWVGSYEFAIQGLWSNADGSCVLPFDNKDHLYLLDGYGGISPSGSAPALASPDYLGYDIGRGLAFFGGASGGYWMDGFGHLHPVGRVASPSLLDRPSFTFDIARSIWPAPWGTPNWPTGYILDGHGGINHFVRGPGPAPAIASPHYTSGADIARALVINPDTYGQNPVSGYMLDGYGTMWPFGGALAVTYPTFSFDIARGVTLLPKTTEFNPGG